MMPSVILLPFHVQNHKNEKKDPSNLVESQNKGREYL